MLQGDVHTTKEEKVSPVSNNCELHELKYQRPWQIMPSSVIVALMVWELPNSVRKNWYLALLLWTEIVAREESTCIVELNGQAIDPTSNELSVHPPSSISLNVHSLSLQQLLSLLWLSCQKKKIFSLVLQKIPVIYSFCLLLVYLCETITCSPERFKIL